MLSTSDTTPAAPLSRSHSTARTPKETFEGLVIAPQNEIDQIEQQDQRGEDHDPPRPEPQRGGSRVVPNARSATCLVNAVTSDATDPGRAEKGRGPRTGLAPLLVGQDPGLITFDRLASGAGHFPSERVSTHRPWLLAPRRTDESFLSSAQERRHERPKGSRRAD